MGLWRTIIVGKAWELSKMRTSMYIQAKETVWE